MEDTNEILSTTSITLINLLKYKNGWDCLALYFRYQLQVRLQENSTTYSTDTFMEKAMGWGKLRLYNAKKILVDEWLISHVIRRGEDGRVSGHYIKINFLIRSQSNHTPTSPESGSTPHVVEVETNTLEKNIINTKEKKINTSTENKETIPKVTRKTIPRTSVDELINSFKESLKVKDYSYSNIKERQFAANLIRNREWNDLLLSTWLEPRLLVEFIMGYANADTFWSGKITSLMTFYYKFPLLINQMKTKGIYKPLNREDEEKRKRDALEFYNSLGI